MNPYQILDIQKNFTLQELKEKYKALAIKVHPDKGGTEELFLLVTKCYKKLLEEYKKKAEAKEYWELKADFHKTQETSSRRQHVQHEDISSHEVGKFNIDRFNKVFTDNRLETTYDKGYQHWMSDAAVTDIPKPKGTFTIDSFNDRFDKSAAVDKKNKFIMKYKEPEGLVATKKIAFTELGEDNIEDFSGDNTTKKHLNYMDYKVAHTTSKIVDPTLLKSVKTFKNIEDLEKHRSSIQYDMDKETMKEYVARVKKEARNEAQRQAALRKYDEATSAQYEKVNILMLGKKP